MTSPLLDLRYAMRALRKSPTFTAAAILTLTLGIGATTALFSVVNGVLLNPLPYPHAQALEAIYEDAPGFRKAPVSYLNFLDWQRSARTFATMAIYRNEDYNFSTGREPERLSGMMVSADFFRTLGQSIVVGRDFSAADDHPGAAPVAILGGGFWERRFGSSPSVVGRVVTLDGQPYTIVGVLPARFTFYGPQRDVYTPIGQWTDASFRNRNVDVSAHAVGRLAPGVSFAAATADLGHLARVLAATYPEADKNVGITLVPLKQDMVGNVRPFLVTLFAAVTFLLLIACANVANLLLARSSSRSREFAIRTALGASRARMVRQLMVESALLALAGGALGLGLAWVATRAVVAALPGTLPRAGDIRIDGHVMLFALAAVTAASLLFGLAPAFRASRAAVHEVLKESGRGSSGVRHRVPRLVVAVEVALAFVLLVGAGLMLRTLRAFWHVNPGFDPSHAITFTLSLPATPNTTSAQTRARLRRFDAAMRDVPGVDAVSVTLGSRPMIHDTALPFWIQGQPKPETARDMPQTMCYLVEAGFQRAMGIVLERGRFVTAQDDEHGPVVVDIDDSFARTYFPHENPIGQRINIGGFDVQAEIVGVVGHIKQWRLDADPGSAVEAQIFYPFMQLPEKLMPLAAGAVAVVLRTRGDPAAIMPAVRRAVREVEPGDVVYGVETMDHVVASSYSGQRLSMVVLGVFAGLALVLACIGIYGVTSYVVSQRTHEIGLRIALGAQRAAVMQLVLGQGARTALAGAVVGGGAALALTGLMAAELFGVTPHDPLTFGTVAALLVGVAVAACYVPARRAVAVDPIVALRSE